MGWGEIFGETGNMYYWFDKLAGKSVLVSTAFGEDVPTFIRCLANVCVSIPT